MSKCISPKYTAHAAGKLSQPPYLEQWVQVYGWVLGACLGPVWPVREEEKAGLDEKFTQTNHKSREPSVGKVG